MRHFSSIETDFFFAKFLKFYLYLNQSMEYLQFSKSQTKKFKLKTFSIIRWDRRSSSCSLYFVFFSSVLEFYCSVCPDLPTLTHWAWDSRISKSPHAIFEKTWFLTQSHTFFIFEKTFPDFQNFGKKVSSIFRFSKNLSPIFRSREICFPDFPVFGKKAWLHPVLAV